MLEMTKQAWQKRAVALAIALIVFVLDWVSKTWAYDSLGDQVINVIPNLFDFRLAFNRGVSFSLFGDVDADFWPHVLGYFAFAVSVIILLMTGAKDTTKLTLMGLALIMGGAIGNGYDRFVYGVVIDFLHFYDFYMNAGAFPTFNIADVAISVGVFFVLIDSIYTDFIKKEEK